MNLHAHARRVGSLMVMAALLASACSATETVTINDAAITSATSTALRENAANQQQADATPPDPQDSQDGEVQDDDPPASDQDAPRTAAETATGCAFDSIDDFDDIQIELSFTNELDEQDDATAAYEVYDGNGDVLVATTTFIEELAPGEQVRIAVDTLTDAPVDRGARSGISCALIDVEAAPFGFDKFQPGPDDSCEFVEVDSFNDVQIRLNVVSPLATASELAIDFALRGPDDVRFGDGVVFTELVDAGQVSSTNADSFTDVPDWLSESAITCDILSIQGF